MRKTNQINLFQFTPVILLFWGVISIIFFEKIPIFNGFGWDGTVYGNLAMDFENMIRNHSLEAYSVQRIFPSFIVFYGLKILNITHSIENVINGFMIYAVILTTACSYLWILISNKLALSIEKKWLGFIFLFINYPFLKFFFYYPTLTDYTAFLIGMIQLYAGLTNNKWLILLSLVISYFTWPTAIVISIILYLFPINLSDLIKVENTTSNKIKRLFTTIFVFCFFSLFLYMIIFLKLKGGKNFIWYLNVVISSLFIFLFVYRVIVPFVWKFPYDEFFKKIVTKKEIFRIAILILLILCLSFVKSFLYNTSIIANHNILKIYLSIITNSIALPLKFIVAHIVFWGPAILFLFIFYSEIYSKIFQYGTGMILITLYILLFGLDSESRHLMSSYPFIVFLLISTLDLNFIEKKFSFFLSIVLVSIFFSKVWLPINMPSTWVEGQSDFPFQRFFMQHGPWMSVTMYIIHTGFIFIISIYLLKYFPIKMANLKSSIYKLNNRN